MQPPAVAYVGTLVDAQRAWSALKGHGLEATLLNQNIEGMVTYGQAEVVVRGEDLEAARGLLEELGLIGSLDAS